ncbi:RGS1-HXK1-interacting protein 1 [Citrus sinensis]|uniref:RGS1-HXK1-interacting protein 1 n=1 Tax=Citrus sinensis TaxID=2711 RepID=A0ACB8MTP3_CITSI|nr:RGS1-HXK1-interacting protein 1 [Citrus sinensis]KAH9788967.1 RGS1-HXK1-interacting protein 1 [Citrus sinensis]
MSEQGESTPTVAAAPAITTRTKDAKEWVEDLQRSVIQSKDSAIRSARSFQHNSSTYLQTLQDFVLHGVSQYQTYEDAFFSKVKDELVSAREHPAAATGVALTAGLLFMRGEPQHRFGWDSARAMDMTNEDMATSHQLKKAGIIYCQLPVKHGHLPKFHFEKPKRPLEDLVGHVMTVVIRTPEGEWLQMLIRLNVGHQWTAVIVRIYTQAMFVRAEKNVNELNLSGELMKKESKKLLERAALAEKEMIRGETELKNAGNQVQRLAKQVYKVETQAADLMEGLREIPGREALKLRAEASPISSSFIHVASMASLLKRQRAMMDKQIMKISELGVSV